MNAGRERFAQELRGLGYLPEPSDSDAGFLWFQYEVPNGPRRGEVLQLGFQVPPNFPHEPPHGPCYRPAILRNNGLGGVHPDRPQPGWDHWSRPHPSWPQTKQGVGDYMRYIRRLNEELPDKDSPPTSEANG